MQHWQILEIPTGSCNKFLLPTAKAFWNQCLILVVSSGIELYGGGCTSPMPRLGPGTVLLLVHPAQTRLFIPVDLGCLCTKSRIWKHLTEAQPSGTFPLGVRPSEPHTGHYWPAFTPPHSMRGNCGFLCSDDTVPVQIEWGAPAPLGAGTILHIRQDS